MRQRILDKPVSRETEFGPKLTESILYGKKSEQQFLDSSQTNLLSSGTVSNARQKRQSDSVFSVSGSVVSGQSQSQLRFALLHDWLGKNFGFGCGAHDDKSSPIKSPSKSKLYNTHQLLLHDSSPKRQLTKNTETNDKGNVQSRAPLTTTEIHTKKLKKPVRSTKKRLHAHY